MNFDKRNISKAFEILFPVLTFVIPFVIYSVFRSISYDDWDSIQFALGIEDFNLELHQPHAPGYPVYIFVLKIINELFKNHLLTMTFLSAISGAIGSLLFYFLLEKLFRNKYISFGGAFALIFFPLYAVNSVKALSDIFAVSLYVGWLLLLVDIYRISTSESKSKQSLFYKILALGLLSGITIGVRIQIIVAMIIPLILILVRLYKSKDSKNIFALIFSGLIGTLIWLIPVISDVGGLGKFVDIMMGRYLWRYGISAHTPFDNGFSPYHFLIHGISHVYNLIRGGFGVSLPYGQFKDSPTFVIIASIIAFLVVLFLATKLLIKNIKKEKVQLFLVSAFPYLIFMYFNLTYENPRYWLPLIPFLIIFLIWGIIKLFYFYNKLPKKIETAELLLTYLVIIVSGIMVIKSFELLNILHTEVSPPTKAIE